MKQVIDRLLRDMRWRLTPAADHHEPARKEWEAWGVRELPWWMPVLGGCLLPMIVTGALSMLNTYIAWASEYFWLPVAVVGAVVGFGLRGVVHRRIIYWAYKKQLASSERFALTEYALFLKRHTELSDANPARRGLTRAQCHDLSKSAAALVSEDARRQALAHVTSSSEIQPSGPIAAEANTNGRRLRLPDDIRSRLEAIEIEVRRSATSGLCEQGTARGQGA